MTAAGNDRLPPLLRRILTLGTDTSDPRDDAELALGIVFFVMGFGAVIQALLAMPTGARLSSEPAVYVGLTLAMSATVVGFCIATFRRGTPSGMPWGWAMIGLTVGSAPVMTAILPESELLGSWTASVFAFSQYSVVVAGAWLRSVRRTFVLAVAMAASYSWLLLNADGPYSEVSVMVNALNYPIFGLAVSLVSQYWRILAQRSYDAHQATLRATRQMELDRYRLVVHDTSGILRMLGDEATPPEVLPALREQALGEANRLRQYLAAPPAGTDQAGEAGPGRICLGDVLAEATQGFTDLPLEISTVLAADAVLAEADAVALQRAVVTLLHNVRRHAQASTVWVHADAVDGRWEVVVRDDGVGFTADPATYGFGLREQVLGALSARGIAIDIDSSPGDGCAVTMSGPVAAPERRNGDGTH